MKHFFPAKIIDDNVKNLGYNEHLLTARSFLHIFLLVVSGTTECKASFKRTVNPTVIRTF